MKPTQSFTLIVFSLLVLLSQSAQAGPNPLTDLNSAATFRFQQLAKYRASLKDRDLKEWNAYVAAKNDPVVFKGVTEQVLSKIERQKNIKIEFALHISAMDKAVYLMDLMKGSELDKSIPKADSKLTIHYFGPLIDSPAPAVYSLGDKPEGLTLYHKNVPAILPGVTGVKFSKDGKFELHSQRGMFDTYTAYDLVEGKENKATAETAVKLADTQKPILWTMQNIDPLKGQTEMTIVFQTPAELPTNTDAFVIDGKFKRHTVSNADELKAEQVRGANTVAVGSLKALKTVVEKINNANKTASINPEAEMAQILDEFKLQNDRCKI